MADPGLWLFASDFAFQWRRCESDGTACADIAGAINSSYSVGSADVGKRLQATVTVRSDFGTREVITKANTSLTDVVEGDVQTLKRPPQGKWAAAGEGSEVFSAGNVRNAWSDMTFEVIYDGDCWVEKMTMHSKRWAEFLFCPTSDGGLVLSLTRTYNIMPVLSLGEIHNLATTKCEPVRVYMSSNMEAGQQLDAGSCVNTNEQCAKGFTGCKVSPLIPDSSVDQATVTVIGKETVSGQEAWHVQMNQSMVSQTGNSVGAVVTVDPHNQEHFWFRTTDGLPLRMDRVTNAKTTTTVGIVSTFKEQGSMYIAEPPPVS